MKMDKSRVLRVGLAVGQGTGPELADIFEKVLLQLAKPYAVQIELHRSSRVYHSYRSLLSKGNREEMHAETMRDAEHYESFCKEEAGKGTRVIFRTAITAQPLYLVREHLEAIKVERFHQGSTSILFIRDQAQGFYTGSNNYDLGKATLSRTCQFSKEVTGRIISYSLDRARQANHAVDTVFMVYKHHLFEGIFDLWATEWSKEHRVKIEFIQPDTMNRNLLASVIKGQQLMIAGNEYGDIMQVILLDMFGQGAQEVNCAENVYLHPQLSGLSEYQTVHGSADDLVGKGILNPSAVMKAAAAILEQHGHCLGVREAMDYRLQTLAQQNSATPDQGGDMSTEEFVDAVLDKLQPTLSPPEILDSKQSPRNHVMLNEKRLGMGKKTALIVMDCQNDFVVKDKHGFKGEEKNMTSLAPNIGHVVDFIRSQQQEVIFMRYLGDVKYQRPNLQYRDHMIGSEKLRCLEHSWGAELFPPLRPETNERVFDKHAVYDGFLCPDFEPYLKMRGFQHLIFVGLYGDVCVDSTARTAFQKGYFLTVISDCTATLHVPVSDCLEFMKRTYGARLLTHDRLMDMSD